jgi:hypothetical protein
MVADIGAAMVIARTCRVREGSLVHGCCFTIIINATHCR